MSLPCRGSPGPLPLLIDGTGIKAAGEGEWPARKHGGPKRRLWRKIDLGTDEHALEVRALEGTSSDVGEAPMRPERPERLGRIAPDRAGSGDRQRRGRRRLTATRRGHDAIAERGVHAVVPPRGNAKPWNAATAGAVARSEALRASRCPGRALGRRWSARHRRSRAETKMRLPRNGSDSASGRATSTARSPSSRPASPS